MNLKQSGLLKSPIKMFPHGLRVSGIDVRLSFALLFTSLSVALPIRGIERDRELLEVVPGMVLHLL